MQREGQTLRVLYMEAFENHLRTAPIRHGDSVIVVIKRFPGAGRRGDKEGGTAR